MKAKPKKLAGFSYVEIVISVLLIGGAVVFMINVIPDGIDIFRLGLKNHRLYFLAKEKMAEIKAQGFWITDVDTNNPDFPSLTNDLAVMWQADLDKDARSFSSNVRGQISVTHLTSSYSSFSFLNFLFSVRERYEITVTVSDGSDMAIVKSYLTKPASKKSLMGILYTMQRALILYSEDNGSYPPTNGLDDLVSSYLPYIPNDPYTTRSLLSITGVEEEGDYSYSRTGGTRKLFANSHPESLYPDMVLTW